MMVKDHRICYPELGLCLDQVGHEFDLADQFRTLFNPVMDCIKGSSLQLVERVHEIDLDDDVATTVARIQPYFDSKQIQKAFGEYIVTTYSSYPTHVGSKCREYKGFGPRSCKKTMSEACPIRSL